MLAQASTTIADSPGFGVAEWIGIATIATVLLGAIVQLIRLRRENTKQHREGRELVTDVRDRLLDLHTSVNRVDTKVDQLDQRLDRHENIHHRRRRKW